MAILSTFWTPCFYYDDVRNAVNPISFYTAISSIISIAYTAYVMNGGDSSQFYMPYFETDIRYSTQVAGALAIIYFLLFLGASCLLVYGVNLQIRGYMIPWMVGMTGVIVYMLFTGFHWLFDYYIYLDQIFALLCLWLWMSYNIYCLLAIISIFQILTVLQTPDLIVIESAENHLFYWDETV